MKHLRVVTQAQIIYRKGCFKISELVFWTYFAGYFLGRLSGFGPAQVKPGSSPHRSWPAQMLAPWQGEVRRWWDANGVTSCPVPRPCPSAVISMKLLAALCALLILSSRGPCFGVLRVANPCYTPLLRIRPRLPNCRSRLLQAPAPNETTPLRAEGGGAVYNHPLFDGVLSNFGRKFLTTELTREVIPLRLSQAYGFDAKRQAGFIKLNKN